MAALTCAGSNAECESLAECAKEAIREVLADGVDAPAPNALPADNERVLAALRGYKGDVYACPNEFILHLLDHERAKFQPRGFLAHWPAIGGVGRQQVWTESLHDIDAIGCPFEPLYTLIQK